MAQWSERVTLEKSTALTAAKPKKKSLFGLF
jgi:hypothetical protein